ncbi:MAG TPA: hypothetical protein VGW38_05510 [Chloroflexota bacterium]|nr:hypothetical protein [Chloroflexota bacterium]
MLFLILHIAGNAAFLLLVRLGRSARFDYYTVGVANYATAALLSIPLLLAADLPTYSLVAAVLGAVNGFQYLSTYFFMYVLIGLAGIAITSGFLRLSVAVPVFASMLIWHEWPSPLQAVGLVLAGFALPLMGSRSKHRRVAGKALEVEQSAVSIAALIATTILISGSGLLAAKAFTELQQPEQRPLYTAAVYTTATLLGLAAWPWRHRFRPPPSLIIHHSSLTTSLGLGALVGVVNIGQLLALLPALSLVPGVIAFPLSSAGGLALATLGAWIFWREPLGGRTGAGIVLAIAAAALVNAA